jgi:hypothetical protein
MEKPKSSHLERKRKQEEAITYLMKTLYVTREEVLEAAGKTAVSVFRIAEYLTNLKSGISQERNEINMNS